MHLLLKLILARPQLLADHAQAYAELVAADLADATGALSRRLVVGGAAVLLLLTGTVLAGVALLLCAVTTGPQIQAPWALIVVPLVPLLASAACGLWLHLQAPMRPFAPLQGQLQADLELLRESRQP